MAKETFEDVDLTLTDEELAALEAEEAESEAQGADDDEAGEEAADAAAGKDDKAAGKDDEGGAGNKDAGDDEGEEAADADEAARAGEESSEEDAAAGKTAAASSTEGDTPDQPGTGDRVSDKQEEVPLEREAGVLQATRKLPADYQAQLTQFDTSLSELDDKYDKGELSFKDWRAQQKAIHDQRDELKDIVREHTQVASLNQQARSQRWNDAVDTFLDENAQFRRPALGAALDAELQELYADPRYKGARYEYLLTTARDRVLSAFGTEVPANNNSAPNKGGKGDKPTPAAQRVRNQARKAAAARDGMPKNLGDVPAASGSDSGDEFAHLDKLDAMSLEHALSRMTPEQAERYLSGR